jgi:hypothetical protein
MHARRFAPLWALALFAPLAQAQTHWVCSLTADALQLACVAEADPLRDATPAPAPTVRVNGTAFPLDPARRYVVDLFGPPTELAPVEHLARATICYRSPGCTVTLAEAAWPAAGVPVAKGWRVPR